MEHRPSRPVAVGLAGLRSGGVLALALLGVLAGAPVADAQDRWPSDPGRFDRVDRRFPRGRPARGAARAPDEFRTLGLESLGRVHGAAAGGSACASTSALTDVDYDDVFGAGTGVGATAYLPFFLREFGERRVEFAVGPLLAADLVTYPGRRYLDPSGDALEPDALRLATAVAGFHFRMRLGRDGSPVKFSLGAELGLGLARLGRVEATLAPAGSSVIEGTLFEATTTGAFHLGVRIGISGQPARGVDLGLSLYLGLGITGAPRDGDLASAALRPDAGAVLNGVAGVALSVGLRFRA